MTEEQLEALVVRTRKAQAVVAGLVPSEPNVGASSGDVLRLVEEVRSLRDFIRHAQRYYHSHGIDSCSWCSHSGDAFEDHEPDCFFDANGDFK